MEFLYRGVSPSMHEDGHGLRPKAEHNEFSSYIAANTTYACAGNVHARCGLSEVSEIEKHQHNQKGKETSGISTSPFFKRAKCYALGKASEDAAPTHENGYVYKISIELLKKHNIKILSVNATVLHPAVSDDDEKILVASDNGCIPLATVVEIIPV